MNKKMFLFLLLSSVVLVLLACTAIRKTGFGDAIPSPSEEPEQCVDYDLEAGAQAKYVKSYAQVGSQKPQYDQCQCAMTNSEPPTILCLSVMEAYCDKEGVAKRKEISCDGNGCENDACRCPKGTVWDSQQQECVESGGDEWFVGDKGERLEISELLKTGYNRENFHDIRIFIDKDDLPNGLASGRVSNRHGVSEYNQYLYFDNTPANSIAGSNYVVIGKDGSTEHLGVYLFYKADQNIARYELDFTTSFMSDISGSSLPDYEGKRIIMLEKKFVISEAIRPNAQNSVRLTLLGGDLQGVLEEGETRGFESYEVTAVEVDYTTETVEFLVNDEKINEMAKGDCRRIADESQICVIDILPNEEGPGADLVTFYLRAKKIVLQDDDVSRVGVGEKTLRVDGEMIDGATVIILGSDDGPVFKIDSIQVDMDAQNDYYVDQVKTLSEEIESKGDDPELLFTENWDIDLRDFDVPNAENIFVRPSGADKYNLVFVDGKGYTVSAPLAYTSGGSELKMGDDDDDLIMDESLPITKLGHGGDYFIITDETKPAGERPTYLMRYKGADGSIDPNHKIKLRNVGTGETYEKTYQVNSRGRAYATFFVGGIEFIVVSHENGAAIESNNFDIRADLNADGTRSLTKDVLAITTQAGAQIDIEDLTESQGQIDVKVSTPNPDAYDSLVPTPIEFKVVAENGEVEIEDTGNLVYKIPNGVGLEDKKITLNSYGVIVEWDVNDGDLDVLEIDYPEKQVLPMVYVTTGIGSSTVQQPDPLPQESVPQGLKILG